MKLKKTMMAIVLSMFLVSTVFAAYYKKPVRRNAAQFHKGDMLFTGEFAIFYKTVCLGGNFEYFLTPNISVGGDLVGTLNSPTVMIASPDVAYHFDLKEKNIDVFAGAGPALAFQVRGSGGSVFGFKPFAGGRYFIKPKMAIYAKLMAFLASGSSFGASFGVTYWL
jgi:type 1 fimbria pilin